MCAWIDYKKVHDLTWQQTLAYLKLERMLAYLRMEQSYGGEC